MNKIFKSLIWLGRIFILLFLAYFIVALFFAENSFQLGIGFFIILFMIFPAIFILFFKEKFLKKFPKFDTAWCVIRIVYTVIIIMFFTCYIYGCWREEQAEKTQQKIDFISSKKITINDVNGKNLPPQPNQKLNDSTIAGIDANKNYVRDDVELAIFAKYPNSAKIRAAEIQYAQALQLELTQVFNSSTLVAVIRGYEKNSMVLDKKGGLVV